MLDLNAWPLNNESRTKSGLDGWLIPCPDLLRSDDDERMMVSGSMFVCLFVCSIFTLLSQKSDGGALFWTNPHSLKS